MNKPFAKIVDGKKLIIFAHSFTIDIFQGPKYDSDYNHDHRTPAILIHLFLQKRLSISFK